MYLQSFFTSLSLTQFLTFLLTLFLFVLNCIFKKRELVDLATVSDQEIKSDDVVYMMFTKDNGGWEELSADTLVSFGGSDGAET